LHIQNHLSYLPQSGSVLPGLAIELTGWCYEFITVAPIVIEAGAWIGAAATILPGVRIGHDSVVGAGAVRSQGRTSTDSRVGAWPR
jgi:acetyltransferase-like isoleucine patch superfamily enzyme